MTHPIDQNDIYRRLVGLEARVEALDIVERLPEEGEPSDEIMNSYREAVSIIESPPTMTASDGKQYPMELFGVRQRFSDRTPPEGVDIETQRYDGDLQKGIVREGKVYWDVTPIWHWLEEFIQDGNWTRTLAPSVAVEKSEPQIWDEYLDESSGCFIIPEGVTNGGIRIGAKTISRVHIIKKPDAAKALIAYIQHILSQNKGES